MAAKRPKKKTASKKTAGKKPSAKKPSVRMTSVKKTTVRKAAEQLGIDLTTQQRIKLILLVIALFCVGVVCLLHFTGIVPFENISVMLGLSDKPATRSDLEVHFIDVGQGDCTLIMSQGEVMVIDSGDRDETNRAQEYLREHGVKRIDYLIATHPHADHIGEMAEIIEGFEVENFIMPRIPDKYVPTSRTYEDMLLALQAKGLKATPASDSSFTLGCCEVQTFASPMDDSENMNNYSVVVKIVNGKNSFLITGDCEKAEEKELIAKGFDLSAKVLKVGHHGSSTSSSAAMLDEVDPDYAVISCGKDNSYGHPHDETVRRLSKYANEVYVTAARGDVVFISDGKGLSVECSGEDK